ncbi:MAG: CHAD domain-containing protein [Gallionella sp.]|nr:CHAD domain-containing protein [Gallionella sp.]
MALETELKLRITPAQMVRLKRHALLKSYRQGRVVQRQLYNIYFDTPKQYLHRHAMALRLRRSGSQWLQTLKGGGAMQAGLHQRNEWEVPVAGESLDFTDTDEIAWQSHLPQRVRNKLQPVFVTDFSRAVYQLEWQGAHVELCMDHGEISSGEHALPLCEVELELKSGQPHQLFELALTLLDVVPFELETVSKAEYGYRLMSAHIERPSKAALPVIGGKVGLAEALKTVLWSCVAHLQANARGQSAATDSEFLHQMRVALRRLRVALRMAKKLHSDAVLDALLQQARVLSGYIGEVRDWDVFIAEVARPALNQWPDHLGVQHLLNLSEQARQQRHDKLFNEAGRRALQRFILDFAVWMNSDYWVALNGQSVSLRKFAKRHMRRLLRRLQADDAQTQEPLHTLRILTKKLRYSAEFFTACNAGDIFHAVLRQLGKVQEQLGKIHDIAVARTLLEKLAAQDDGLLETVAMMQTWLDHKAAACNKPLRKSLKRLLARV